ncbi:hypothetical protein PGT21_007146 [Puccinia graminis f. sp. tritici]|uniref:Uncharacterized protein n=1 Tax=Puccinia graminis f. sp. tritici TaxID=56615 RepID=A0A5B0MYX7_PUCGR|nr:hypothetical protein PGT21_007146 [Puccinia graminis f. sp. tritici]KAA1081513.1 hypothetical protein PGTUg99_008957 [Puccinia graminis f. sp. tritici]
MLISRQKQIDRLRSEGAHSQGESGVQRCDHSIDYTVASHRPTRTGPSRSGPEPGSLIGCRFSFDTLKVVNIQHSALLCTLTSNSPHYHWEGLRELNKASRSEGPEGTPRPEGTLSEGEAYMINCPTGLRS